MRRSVFISAVLWSIGSMSGSFVYGQGYMSFQNNGPTGTTVNVGNAGSFMRSVLEWDKATVVGDRAIPTIVTQSRITTWRDGTNLYFKFSIPANTEVIEPGGAALACGDRVIVQIARTKPTATTATLDTTGANKYFRYEVTIRDNVIDGGAPVLRVPRLLGANWVWRGTPAATTATTSTSTVVGGQYEFTLTIPLAEIRNPTTDIGLALAIINDLGRSHVEGAVTVNEASGSAFPVSMGLTPESEPGLTCAAIVPLTEDATGNWVKPNTWGTGFWQLATVPPSVTLNQVPYPALSSAIRLGNCAAQWGDIQPIPGLAGWEAFQQNSANNWYLYHPDGPCRMAIWINARVAAGGVVNKRFMVVFGRPGISPTDWYFAGVTDPVALNADSTQLSFLWDRPPAVDFMSHPCLRVYIIRDNITAAGLDSLRQIDTDAELNTAVGRYVDNTLTQQSAQMNFANIAAPSDPQTCPSGVCSPLGSVQFERRTLARASAAFTFASLQQRPDDRPPTRGEDEIRFRVLAHGYGVAAATPTKPYVYVEPIGSVGWFVPQAATTNGLTLNFDVTNPRVVETLFVGGTQVDVPAVPRRVLVAIVAEAPAGVNPPTIDRAALDRFNERVFAPGETDSVRVTLTAGVAPTPPSMPVKWWWWLLALLVVLALIVWVVRRRQTAP